MIVYRKWKRIKYYSNYSVKNRYIWEGWFLFGIIPLFLKRKDIDL